MFYFFVIEFFNQDNALELFDIRRKLSTQILIIKISLLALSIMNIFSLIFKDVNLKILKNGITFWFQNQPDYFKLYMIFKNLNKKLTLTDLKSIIFGGSFIKLSNQLFLIKLFKYTLIISICFIKNTKSVNMIKKIFSDLQCIIRANILLKLTPGI